MPKGDPAGYLPTVKKSRKKKKKKAINKDKSYMEARAAFVKKLTK